MIFFNAVFAFFYDLFYPVKRQRFGPLFPSLQETEDDMFLDFVPRKNATGSVLSVAIAMAKMLSLANPKNWVILLVFGQFQVPVPRV